MASEKNTAEKKSSWFKNVSDTNLLLMITIVVFFVMYISAMIFLGSGFLKPQAFFNILNANTNPATADLFAGLDLVDDLGGHVFRHVSVPAAGKQPVHVQVKAGNAPGH